MSSGVLFLLIWIVILALFAWIGFQGLGKGWLSSPIVLGLGLLLFAGLCWMCFSMHGPAASNAVAVAPAANLAAPDLDARLFDGKVTLNGTLPDQAAKDKIVARAKELYGDGKYVDNLKVSNQRAYPHAGWLPAALGLLPVANQANNEGGIALDAKSVIVRGFVESEEAKNKLIAEATKSAGANVGVIDKVIVKGKVTEAQAADFQANLNQMIAGKIIEFETGKDIITPKGKEILDQMVQVLAQVPGVPVEVSGHTDSRGSAAMNLDLSQRRAVATRKYLTEHGVSADRLSAKGYGSTKPVADNNTPDGQQRNRRIDFTVVKEGK